MGTKVKNIIAFTVAQKSEIVRCKFKKILQDLYAENYKPMMKSNQILISGDIYQYGLKESTY